MPVSGDAMTTVSTTPLDTRQPTTAAVRDLQEILASIARGTGLSLYLKPVEGPAAVVMDRGKLVPYEPNRSPASTWLIDAALCSTLRDGSEVYVRDGSNNSTTATLMQAVIDSSLRTMEAERREARLREELEASWENLDALYEISTQVLRSGNINDALRRLLGRLTAISNGLYATLFINREGKFHALVSTGGPVADLAPEQLGILQQALVDMRVMLVSVHEPVPDSTACWRNATSVAAAPFSWRGSTGFVVTWCENKACEFDSSFCRVLEAITYQASVMMEGDRLNRRVRESELLAQEVQIASSIQQTLLLANAPRAVPAMQIAACSIPSNQIDGDFHDFFQHPNGTVDVLIGDVMGKGVAAALIGAATKSQVLRATANLALRSMNGAPHPAEIITRAASRLSDRLISLERFVTLCYARFHASTNMLTFTDCGHTSIIRARRTQPECTFLRGADLPLGIFPDFHCEEQSVALFPGDTYVFYSDGVTECRSPDGELFGQERLAEYIQQWSALGPTLLVEQIQEEAVRFTQSNRFADDFTCIAIRIKLYPDGQTPVASRAASFVCNSDELSNYRQWLRTSIAILPGALNEDDVERLELACTELFANCFIHVPSFDCLTPVEVLCDVYESRVSITMRHCGPSFDPLTTQSPTFDGSRDGGFGIYIVLRSADEVRFTRDAQGTNITNLVFARSTTE